MSIVDLHTHSSASDGQYDPRELVTLAKEQGIEVLALTDHDNFDGTAEAISAGKEQNLLVLRGIEIGAREFRNLHILGYGFSAADENLNRLCEKLKNGREERNQRIIAFLKEKGIELDLQEVKDLARGGVIGRPHFAQVMVKHGYVANNREAFDRYLDTHEYKRIAPWKAGARECVETLKSAGAKVSLAHPYQLGLENEKLERLVAELKSFGLDALECYYPKHTAEQQTFYLALAEKYGLHATGGSDFHGEKVKPDVKLARLELDVGWLLS